jgi:hypothetical protein
MVPDINTSANQRFRTLEIILHENMLASAYSTYFVTSETQSSHSCLIIKCLYSAKILMNLKCERS